MRATTPSARRLLTLASCAAAIALHAQNLSWYRTWIYDASLGNLNVQYFSNGPMCVDADGNTIMASTLLGTMDVDPGPGTEVFSAGTYIIGQLVPVVTCISKLDANGDWMWTRQLGVSPGRNTPICIGQDPTGNIYVSGWFKSTVDFDPGPGVANLSSAGSEDIYVLKLDPDGNYLWARAFGTSAENEAGWDLAVDASGNCFVMLSAFGTFDVDPGPGVVPFSPSTQLSSILKLDMNGNYVWAKTIESPYACSFHHMAIDPNGDLSITGTYGGGDMDADPGLGITNLPMSTEATTTFIMKWTGAGELLWARSLLGVYPRDIACDGAGNTITVGGLVGEADLDPGPGVHVHNDGNGWQTGFILKLDAQGLYAWSKAWTTSDLVQIDQVLADHNDNLVFAGIYSEDMDLAPGPLVVPAPHVNFGRSAFLTTLDANGSYLWSGSIGGGATEAYIDYIALTPDNGLRLNGWFDGAVDMDPGSAISIYSGPTNPQSMMLIAIDNMGISTALSNEAPVRSTVYPSPTQDLLNITSDERIGRINVRATNGQLLLAQSAAAQRATVDLSTLSAGCYIIELIGENRTERQTVMKY